MYQKHYYLYSGKICTFIAFLYSVFVSMTDLHAQDCAGISSMPCTTLQVQMPFNLSFTAHSDNSLADSGGQGTGFRMVQNYSGTRLPEDGPVTDSQVPGFVPSRLEVTGGVLRMQSSKGIAFMENDNQINTLGVKINTQSSFEISTDIIKPYNGSKDEQAGLWVGMNDRSFVKLVATKNKLEFRREHLDQSSRVAGLTNPDQRITGTITGLNTKTLRLKIVVDPDGQTISGFYSVDSGATYLNVGDGYPSPAISIAGMGLTDSTAFAGIFASHRGSSTPVNYIFDNFSVNPLVGFTNNEYNFTVSDASLPGTSIGSVSALGASNYRIICGNTNALLALNGTNGELTIAKKLNYHTQSLFHLSVEASAGSNRDTVQVHVQVTAGTTVAAFTKMTWDTAASQPYRVSEAQGEVVNGKLYTFGGFDSQKSGFTPTFRSYRFDPVANTWSAIAKLPHLPNGTNFGGITHAGITNDGTDIYIAGGYTSNSAGTGQSFGTQQVWKYEIATNTYTRLPDLPIKIAAGQLEYLNGKLHHIAGTNAARTQDLGNHYILDLDNLAAGWATLAPLPNPRQHSGSAVFEGKIYYMGGQRGHDDKLMTLKDMHRYDPETDTWTKMADILAPGTYGLGHISSAVAITGDRIILVGGEIVHGQAVNLVSAYSPATNSWASLTPLKSVRFSGVAAFLEGKLFYTGGSNSKLTMRAVPIMPAARVAAAELPVPGKTVTAFPNPAVNGTISLSLSNFEKNEKVRIIIMSNLGEEITAIDCIANEKGEANAAIRHPASFLQKTYIIQARSQSGLAMGRVMTQ